jgi:pimeloyl-ACP methyl ester carboxylesterase
MNIFLYIIPWVVGIFIALLLIVSISLLTYSAYLEKSTNIKTANGISSLEEIKLGGVKQWIFIRGTNQNNPILLFLHGGPGAPLMGISSSRNFDAEFIKHFTVVHWDQRGAGKSYRSDFPINSMTLDRLVEDCNELIEYLRNRLSTQKVFLVGHSAGTVIGIKTAYKFPERIHAYVGVAQIINNDEQQRISYYSLVEEAEKSGDRKVQNALEAIGAPPYDTPEDLYEKDGYVGRYGGLIRENVFKQMGVLMLSFLTSPEYSLSEGLNTLMNKGFKFSMSAMWEELRNVNLTNEIESIEVPIYFFEGKYDMATPAVLVENFYNSLDAKKGKTLIIFENSAHFPMKEEKEKYEDLLINVVLKDCQDT